MNLLAADLIKHMRESVIITDPQGSIQAVNGSFTRVTGYELEEVLGKNPRLLQSGRHDKRFYRSLWTSVVKNGHWSGEIWNRRKNGEIYPEWLTITVVANEKDQVTHYLGVFTDITDRKLSEERLTFMAHHDALTELPNRFLLQDRLNQALALARRRKHSLAVLYLDLDNFKPINDSKGHGFGDALLKAAARRLTSAVRDGDTVARLGGDEFVIVLSLLKQEQDAFKVARHILRDISLPFEIAGHTVRLTLGIGISLYPADGTDAQNLLGKADIALYRAKEKGGNIAERYRQSAGLPPEKALRKEDRS